jgi:protein-S-isoprenylcysteine O-methyltransferase Ste14
LATVAVWMLVAFGVLTFGVRVAIQVRRTGSTGLIGLREGAGIGDWLSGILFIGGVAIAVTSVILVLDDSLEPIDSLDTTFLHVVGLVLATTGGLAVFGAQLGMGESWRVGVSDEERTDLITAGWFSICRNPIYAAMILGWIGFALIVPTWLGFLGAAVVAAALELQVRYVEEPYLMRAHGQAYRDYASRVGRFVPGLGLFR